MFKLLVSSIWKMTSLLNESHSFIIKVELLSAKAKPGLAPGGSKHVIRLRIAYYT